MYVLGTCVRVCPRLGDFVPGQATASQSVDAARRRRQVGTGTDGFVCHCCCRKSGKQPGLTVNLKGNSQRVESAN